MSTNPLTGETVLIDREGAHEYRIIFTEEALIQIENALDLSILELVDKASSRTIKLRELQVCVWAGMNAWNGRSGTGKAVSAERALTVVGRCGGLVGVIPLLVDAMLKCSVLGIPIAEDADDGDDDGDELDPTSGGD